MPVIQSMLASLGINETIFVMLGIFVFTYISTRVIGLKKLSDVLAERDHRIEGRQEESHKLRDEAHAIQIDLAEAMKDAQREAARAFASVKNVAIEEQRNILNAAREKSSTELKQVRDKVTQNLGSEMKKVEGEIPKLARQILDQMVGGSAKTRQNPSIGTEA